MAKSGGKLQRRCSAFLEIQDEDGLGLGGDGDQGDQGLGSFDLSRCLFVPGVKHMLDNVEQDLLKGLDWYPTFSDTGLQPLPPPPPSLFVVASQSQMPSLSSR